MVREDSEKTAHSGCDGSFGTEIAFIHEANTETRKAELFGKVRSGQVRFLLGSTQKMGAGTNVQDRLIALHHLDVPWRPSDVGRILRTFKIKRMRR